MPNQNRVLVDMLAACRLVEPGAERIAADNAKLEGIIGRPHHTGRPVYISSKFREKCCFDRDFQRASLRTRSNRRTGGCKQQRKRQIVSVKTAQDHQKCHLAPRENLRKATCTRSVQPLSSTEESRVGNVRGRKGR